MSERRVFHADGFISQQMDISDARGCGVPSHAFKGKRSSQYLRDDGSGPGTAEKADEAPAAAEERRGAEPVNAGEKYFNGAQWNDRGGGSPIYAEVQYGQWNQYSRNCSDGAQPQQSIETEEEGTGRNDSMDDIDRKILRLLQDNARTSLKTIAENTFLSSPAVSARIEKLEKDGIISGYHAQVNPLKLGYHIIAFINLNVVPDDKPKFYAYAESVPNILECSCVTGDYSMILKVAFHSTMELDVFIGQLQKFGKTSTQIVFSTHVGPRGVDVQEN